MIGAVLLAAGASTRMGETKPLLPLGGEPLVRRMARRALEAGLEPLVVVLGHDAERVRGALGPLPCTAVVNDAYAEGIVASIRCGLAALPAEVEAAVVLLADQPLVSPRQLRELREAYQRRRPPLVASEYGGVHGPPTLYRRDLFPELLAARGDGCRKRVIRRHLAEGVVLRFPPALLGDVDTPQDYRALVSALEAGPEPYA